MLRDHSTTLGRCLFVRPSPTSSSVVTHGDFVANRAGQRPDDDHTGNLGAASVVGRRHWLRRRCPRRASRTSAANKATTKPGVREAISSKVVSGQEPGFSAPPAAICGWRVGQRQASRSHNSGERAAGHQLIGPVLRWRSIPHRRVAVPRVRSAPDGISGHTGSRRRLATGVPASVISNTALAANRRALRRGGFDPVSGGQAPISDHPVSPTFGRRRAHQRRLAADRTRHQHTQIGAGAPRSVVGAAHRGKAGHSVSLAVTAGGALESSSSGSPDSR